MGEVIFMECEKDITKRAGGSKGRPGKNEGILMSVKELGETLGLKKTERYRLMHMGFFETRIFLGKMMAVRESFEQWYAGQVRYRKVNGEAPGSKLKEWSWSIQDIARILGLHPSTVYALISREGIETVETNHCMRIPKDAFERWYAGQDRYNKVENTGQDIQEHILLKDICRKPKEGTGNGEFITVDEAIRICGFSRTTISNWIRAGHFKAEKTGGSLKIRRAEFLEWMDRAAEDGKGAKRWRR